MTIFKLPKWGEKIADKKWNVALVWILRIVLGCVFIFSGFVKAVDPWGGYYKLVEYCNAYGFESLAGAALGLSFALAALEFMLGVFVLVGAFRRGAPALLLCMMCVMLPLTLDLAITDRVAHCGCFGDAVVLSNWQSFWKNVALTLGLVYLICFNRRMHGVYGPAVNWIVGLISFIFIAAVGYNGYFKQPLLDFAKYKVGTMIGVTPAEEGSDEDYIFIYSKDGKEQEFTIDNLPDEDNGWTYVDRRFKEGKEPKARVINQSIVVFDSGTEITEDVLPDTGRVVMFLFPDLKNVNISYSFNLNEITTHAKQQGMSVFAVTPAEQKDITWWYDISMADYPIYSMDDSELKSIARGNPAVVMVKDGKIIWKRTLASIPDDRIRDAEVNIELLDNDYNHRKVLGSLLSAFLLALAALLVVNRTHVLILAFYHLFRKEPKKQNEASSAESESESEEPENEVPTETDSADEPKDEESTEDGENAEDAPAGDDDENSDKE